MPKISPQYLRKVGLYALGISLLSLGISCIVLSNLGAGPWDLLTISLQKITGLSIGRWQIILNVFMIIITAAMTKKINYICLVPGIAQGIFIDFYIQHLPSGMPPLILLMIGIILSALGIVIYINQGFSGNAIDNFTYRLHEQYGISLNRSKIITDCIPLTVLVLFFFKNLTFFTFFVYLSVPLMIKWLTPIAEKCKLIDTNK
ncbi:hypothetical protein AwErysi_04220 [Erysipelotrichaceae bacterium]|nr:hypothetical protein AwErysi_04220 [Erysipelotrichaceae bacterium]